MDKTVAQYTIDALRITGQLEKPGGGPSPEAIAEVSEFLNQMLDSWNIMRNSIYTISELTFNFVSGQYIYNIGPGAQWNGPRPVKIQRIDLIYETMPQILRLPIELVDVDSWAAIRVPNLPNAIPLQCYYDNSYSQAPGGQTGWGTLYFWPGPMNGFQVEIWAWMGLNSTLGIGDTLFAPPGYARAITYNLAVEILSLYPKRVNVETEQRIMRIAKESKEWVDALNSPSPITAIDQGVMGTKTRNNFNWLATTN